MWLWLKIEQEGQTAGFGMFPLTRLPFGTGICCWPPPKKGQLPPNLRSKASQAEAGGGSEAFVQRGVATFSIVLRQAGVVELAHLQFPSLEGPPMP